MLSSITDASKEVPFSPVASSSCGTLQAVAASTTVHKINAFFLIELIMPNDYCKMNFKFILHIRCVFVHFIYSFFLLSFCFEINTIHFYPNSSSESLSYRIQIRPKRLAFYFSIIVSYFSGYIGQIKIINNCPFMLKWGAANTFQTIQLFRVQ